MSDDPRRAEFTHDSVRKIARALRSAPGEQHRVAPGDGTGEDPAKFAWIIPVGFLDRMVRQRQERIRRSVPDALDLMVVCVEAGISLDAAVLRVAR